MYVRRVFLKLLTGTPHFVRLASSTDQDNEAYLLGLQWEQLAADWNKFADKLNSGVFDVKLWRTACKRLKEVGACNK